MPAYKQIITLCSLLMVVNFAMAQKPKSNTKPKEVVAVQKFKPPKLKTALGNRADSIVSVSVEEAVQLATLPLKITAANGDTKNTYTITSYQCMYKRKGVTEDEQSGKISPTTNVVADLFRITPLPEIWKKIIAEQLKAGEEIFFFDIVVKDTQGRLMFAPNIKLAVQ
jgi:hypothetical protein